MNNMNLDRYTKDMIISLAKSINDNLEVSKGIICAIIDQQIRIEECALTEYDKK